MKRVNYYITDRQYEQLKKIKEATELTISEAIRRALDEYLSTLIKEIEAEPAKADDN